MPLASDLKDMSPMVLTCGGPDKLFDSHKLVLSVPFSDSQRVGVFCARGEWSGALPPLPKLFLLSPTSLPSSHHLSSLSLQLTNSHSIRTQHVAQEEGLITSPLLQRDKLRDKQMLEFTVLRSHNHVGGRTSIQTQVSGVPKPLLSPVPPCPLLLLPLVTRLRMTPRCPEKHCPVGIKGGKNQQS